jgi:hypothetical protein
MYQMTIKFTNIGHYVQDPRKFTRIGIFGCENIYHLATLVGHHFGQFLHPNIRPHWMLGEKRVPRLSTDFLFMAQLLRPTANSVTENFFP